MKKLLVLLFAVVMLVACGNDKPEQENKKHEESSIKASEEAKKEVSDFIEYFNDLAESDTNTFEVRKIKPDEVGAIDKDGNQDLCDCDGVYISASYNEQGNIESYMVSVGESSKYNMAYASFVDKALGLNMSKLNEKTKNILDSEDTDVSYIEDGYKISIKDSSDLGMYFYTFSKQ